MFSLITKQEEFHTLVTTVDWHCAELREVHYGNRYGDVHEYTVVRFLIDLPTEKCFLEICGFDPTSCSFKLGGLTAVPVD